jgi:hypothetical protein
MVISIEKEMTKPGCAAPEGHGHLDGRATVVASSKEVSKGESN